MDESFREGFEYFRNNTSSLFGAVDGTNSIINRENYVSNIEKEINELEKCINDFMGNDTPIKMLKGDVAEFWHAQTFNVEAAVNNSKVRMSVERSHNFASSDIISSDGKKFGLKYYSNGTKSAKAQSISVFQRYKEYQSKGGKDDFTKYLNDRNYKDMDSVFNDSIYSGQTRIIPCDQLLEATDWLEKMINIESSKRPEQVKRYQETLQMLRDRISDNNGNESIPLSKEDAEKLAILAKERKFRASEFEITAPEILNFDILMKESLKAGISAAVTSLVLKVGPELYKAINYLIKTGRIEEGQFKKVGFAAITGSSEGFIRGAIAAAITICCESCILGERLKNTNPYVVGAVTVIALNALKGSYEVVVGTKTRTEVTNELIRDIFIGTCSLLGGKISQIFIEIPVIGYLIGSFVGSVVGSFVYNTGYRTFLSFCIDSGVAMFGIVDQDYRLPEEIIAEIGIKTFGYETFVPESFNPETFEFESFNVDSIEPESIGIKYLRRGVIGINKIGYI